MDEKGDEMAKMTVYHGGYMAVEHPEIRKGRNTKDFGTGFYCTIIKEQAQRWAKRYDTKIVSIYDVRLDSSLKIKDFREMTDEWLDFILEMCTIPSFPGANSRKAPNSLMLMTLPV